MDFFLSLPIEYLLGCKDAVVRRTPFPPFTGDQDARCKPRSGLTIGSKDIEIGRSGRQEETLQCLALKEVSGIAGRNGAEGHGSGAINCRRRSIKKPVWASRGIGNGYGVRSYSAK